MPSLVCSIPSYLPNLIAFFTDTYFPTYGTVLRISQLKIKKPLTGEHFLSSSAKSLSSMTDITSKASKYTTCSSRARARAVPQTSTYCQRTRPLIASTSR